MSDYNAFDENGRLIELTPYMKNKIYREAKELREKIKDMQCTRSECWDVNEHTVTKMMGEMKHADPIRRRYNALMGNLRADPRDMNTERLRRR